MTENVLNVNISDLGPLFELDDEFRNLLHPLSNDERERLIASINRDGCRDKLVIWREHNILIDGYNRLDVCTSLRIPYETMELSFHGRDEVREWIYRNQLARRNATDFQRAEYALKLKPAIEAKAKVSQARKPAESVLTNVSEQKTETVNTRTEVAKLAGVSEGTLAKVEQVLARADPEVIQQAREGKVSINAAAQTVVPAASLNLKKRKGVEIAHRAIGELKKIPMDDELRARAWEIVAGWIEANPADGPTPNFPGWVELKAETLSRVRAYCSRHPEACVMVSQDIKQLHAKVAGYYREHITKQKERGTKKDELQSAEGKVPA